MEPLNNLFNKYQSKTAFKKAGGKILNAPVLFVNWKALNEDRCPYCNNKLKPNYPKTLWRCSGKKHPKKSFAIGASKLSTVKEKYKGK